MRNEEAGRTEERERERESRGGGKGRDCFVMCVCGQFVWRFGGVRDTELVSRCSRERL